jgi:hypothetical protein
MSRVYERSKQVQAIFFLFQYHVSDQVMKVAVNSWVYEVDPLMTLLLLARQEIWAEEGGVMRSVLVKVAGGSLIVRKSWFGIS